MDIIDNASDRQSVEVGRHSGVGENFHRFRQNLFVGIASGDVGEDESLHAGDRSELGERLTRVFFEAWEQPDSRAPLLAILRGAATHDESANLVRQFIQGQVYSEIASGLAEPDAELRIDLAMAQLLGIAYLRHILAVEPIASTPVEELINRVAPVVSRHLTH